MFPIERKYKNELKTTNILSVATQSFTRLGDHQATDRLFYYLQLVGLVSGLKLHVGKC